MIFHQRFSNVMSIFSSCICRMMYSQAPPLYPSLYGQRFVFQACISDGLNYKNIKQRFHEFLLGHRRKKKQRTLFENSYFTFSVARENTGIIKSQIYLYFTRTLSCCWCSLYVLMLLLGFRLGFLYCAHHINRHQQWNDEREREEKKNTEATSKIVAIPSLWKLY